uniref:Carboxypeptidase n=1 Tax=Elaeophora elaphi TaxID=1147741 RepID=A0A0R3RPV3_9BILA
GIALGNGYVDEALNIDTSVLYAYSHGLIDEKTWKSLEKDCCKGCINTCQLINITERRCMSKGSIRNILRFIWSGRINPYDLYRDCKPSSKLDRARIRVMKFGLTGSHPSSMKSDKLIKNQKAPETILDYLSEIAPLAAEVPCINDSALNQYMNSEDVRRALHIRENASRWEVCNDKIITVYEKIRNNMAPYIKAIVKEGVQVLLYYGDTDMACNFIMGQRFSASLKLPRKKTKQPWVFDSQIAGFVTVYKGLIFATVRGAGHMAPQWRAPQMQYLINEFINDGYF